MEQKIVDVKEGIKWIGINDPNLVTFDVVMETKYGTTYNSYFIDGQKKAIIDTAKERWKDDYLKKVKEVTDPATIDYIVVNHTEPDHSGSLKHLLEIAPNAEVWGSTQAINYLSDIMGKSFKHQVVKNGDILDLGNKTIKFISAPNLHWPDSMYSYLVEDKLLFTCDSFGAHYCSDKGIFDDELEDYSESFKYYFDVILKPFSKFILKAIEKIDDLEIDMICPGHGPVLRSTWKEVIEKTKKYAHEYLDAIGCDHQRVLVAYVSAYGYTKEIAQIIANTLESEGIEVDLTDIEHILLGDLEMKITQCTALMVGSPTINQNTLLPVYKLFALINPIRDKGKKATTFGSYGWSGESIKLIQDHLANLKLKVELEGLGEKFYPSGEKKDEIVRFAKAFANSILESAE